MAVSYTHLDVYKRQLQHTISSNSLAGKHLIFRLTTQTSHQANIIFSSIRNPSFVANNVKQPVNTWFKHKREISMTKVYNLWCLAMSSVSKWRKLNRKVNSIRCVLQIAIKIFCKYILSFL